MAKDKTDAAAWVKAVQGSMGKASQSQSVAAPTGAMLPSDATPVKLTYKTVEKTIEKDYALLVIACDPRALIGICDYTKEEIEIFNQFPITHSIPHS